MPGDAMDIDGPGCPRARHEPCGRIAERSRDHHILEGVAERLPGITPVSERERISWSSRGVLGDRLLDFFGDVSHQRRCYPGGDTDVQQRYAGEHADRDQEHSPPRMPFW